MGNKHLKLRIQNYFRSEVEWIEETQASHTTF